MPRHSVRLIATAAVVAACSGTETLTPPSTDLSGGGSAADTTVIVTPGKPPSPPPPVVASFNLSGVVNGHDLGTDTTHVSPVANATITLVKIADVDGDTLKPSVITATSTTDALGAFRLESLAPAYYLIDVTPPAGSPFSHGAGGIGPARATEVKVVISLSR